MKRPFKDIDLVDQQVGERVRARRKVFGISQEKLATAVGVSFQQIQKYEKGTNRISASSFRSLPASLTSRYPSSSAR